MWQPVWERENRYMYMYNWVVLLSTWNYHNIINQLFQFQFSHSVMCNSLRLHELQHNRPPCPSQSPRVHPINLHWMVDAIKPSHPLSSPSPSALNLSQHQGLSKWSALHTRWTKCCSFSFNISPSNEYPGLIYFRIGWLNLLAVQGTLKGLLQ